MTESSSGGSGSGRKSLAVGIPMTGGWKETFLQYAGIPRVRLSSVKEGLERGIRVFLWNLKDPFFGETVGEKVVVITENRFLKKLLNLSNQERRGYYFRMDQGLFSARSFYAHIPCEILPKRERGPGTCYDREGQRIENSGILLHESDHILFLSVPWNILDEQMGSHSEFRPFYSPPAGKHYAETGPSIDFGALRRLFQELVLHGFRHLGLPMVRLRYPFSGNPAFCFRVDADGFSKESTQSVIRISKSIENAPFSWFIDVQGWGRNILGLQELIENNQEVELHCYHHMTYQREKVNRVNLRMGLRRLNRHRVSPRGVGSPYSFWYEGYQEAIRKLGFEYSSEYAFNSDDVPCFPYNDSTYPLQVPVHTGSIGVFEKAGFSAKEMFTSLRATMEGAIQDCGCALICDHPVGRIERYEEAFVDLFKALMNSGCRCIRVSEYAEQARSFLLHEFYPYVVDRSIFVEEPCPGSQRFDIFLPEEGGFQVSSPCDFAFRGGLPEVRDEFLCPPRPAFDTFLAEQAKDESLTNLALHQWYIGLARHNVRRAFGSVKRFFRHRK